ncbi:hypothetical protein E4U54_001315 [Claviceps lovelessii]|nr:hypothetical protein E4U54_001315 [Claviceps lovelessii]
MKFSVISALYMVAVPVLAGTADYNLSCDRVMYDGKNDKRTEVEYFKDVYFNLCMNLFECKKSEPPATPNPADKNVLGRCIGCLPNLGKNWVQDKCFLDPV